MAQRYYPSKEKINHHKQGGFVLVMVLSVLSIITILTLSMIETTMWHMQLLANHPAHIRTIHVT